MRSELDDFLASIAVPAVKPGERAEICRGLSIRQNVMNPFTVLTLRYEADPRKDPRTEEGKAWVIAEMRDMGCRRICRHCDKVWGIEDEECPECQAETELVLSNQWKREFEIDYQAQAGSYVFDSFSRARNTCKPFRIPSTWRRYRCIDHGVRNPTAVLWIAIDEDGSRWVYAEHYESNQTVNYHAKQIHRISVAKDYHALELSESMLREMELGSWVPSKRLIEKSQRLYRTIGDPSMNNRTQKEVQTVRQRYMENGIYITPANNATAGLEILNQWFSEGTLTIFDTCENTIREVEHLVWEEHSDPSRNKREREVDRDNHCYDDITEVLTDNGWKLFRDVAPGERLATINARERLEFQLPTEMIERNYDGELLYLDPAKGGLNFAVTPNHRMVYVGRPLRTGVGYRVMRADELVEHVTIPTAPLPQGALDGDVMWEPPVVRERGMRHLPPVRRVDFARFLGWFISEGSIAKSGRKTATRTGANYYVSIAQKKHREEVRAMLDALGWPYREVAVRPDGVVNFKIQRRELYEYLRSICGDFRGAKRIPREVFSWGDDSLRVLLDALMLGDGTVSGQGARSYFTVDPGLADDVQELAARLGIASRIVRYEPWELNGKNKRPLYRVRLLGKRDALIYADRIERRPYKGKVYCATVPNGTLVVRRLGRTMVCGNSTDALKYFANEFAPKSREYERPKMPAVTGDERAEEHRDRFRARFKPQRPHFTDL